MTKRPVETAEPQWPAHRPERWSIEKLIPYVRNARGHNMAQVAQIAGLIREFGWTMPVLVDEDGRIIAGHGHVLAAHQLAIAEVPVVVARGWTEGQKRAYALADNQVSLNATWNRELLRVELNDLQVEGFDLEMLGFAEADSAATTAEGGELPRAIQLEPAREYAVIMCADEAEWERLKVALRLTPVRRGGYKKGSQFATQGPTDVEVTFSVTSVPVPEPASLPLLGVGLAGVVAAASVSRRKIT